MNTNKTQLVETQPMGNTNHRSRKWCFTLNNYSDSEELVLVKYCETQKHWIIGREVGSEGTPHLQGFFESKNPVSFSTLKNLNSRVHWEKARGTVEQNFDYCGKESIITTNIFDANEELLKEYDDVSWCHWQRQALHIVYSKPSNRHVHVFIDSEGNTGKSFLSKYLALKYNAIIADGKKDNVFNQVKTAIDNKEPTDLIILDIPRHNKDFVNYGMIEQLKNGLLYSGKYEGGKCIFKNPRVIIFSNTDLEWEKMSNDRWIVFDIENWECKCRNWDYPMIN